MAVSLSKGGNVSLSKEAPGLTSMTVGLGWDVRTTDGADFDLDPTFRLSFNANYMWFDNTSSLEALRLQGDIDKEIGLDISAAAIWRPFQHQNVVFRLSGAALIPGDGFNDIYGAENGRDFYYSVLANLVLTY